MKKKGYRSIELESKLERRDFLKIGGGTVLGAGLLLGRPPVFGQEAAKVEPPAKPKTNIDEAMAVPRTSTLAARAFPRQGRGGQGRTGHERAGGERQGRSLHVRKGDARP